MTRSLLYIMITSMLTPCLAKEADVTKPNIIIIFNDDQGYQDLGCFGSPNIKTPRVDQMAREGMRLTDFYVASPVCSASRAALLTGRYPQKVGVSGVFWPNSGPRGLNPKHVTIAETLKEVGYRTAAVGKWHLGDNIPFLPTSQGFDSYYGIPYSNDMYPAKDMIYAEDCLYRDGITQAEIDEAFETNLRKGQPRKLKEKVPLMRDTKCIEFPADQTTLTKRYVDESIAVITESVESGKPFFLYLANTMPHIPLYSSEPFRGTSERGAYGDVIEEIDFHTGRLLDHLKEQGIEENTLVIFTSDNGPWLSKGDRSGSALPLLEGKFTSFEGGCRVPCVMKWPAVIPAGSVCSEIASTMDLHPTLADIAGAEMPEAELDGNNILELLSAKKGSKSPYEYLFLVFKGQAVRAGDWKYHRTLHFTVKKEKNPRSGPALYNLSEDIGETTNLINEYPEVAEELDRVLENHLKSFGNKN